MLGKFQQVNVKHVEKRVNVHEGSGKKKRRRRRGKRWQKLHCHEKKVVDGWDVESKVVCKLRKRVLWNLEMKKRQIEDHQHGHVEITGPFSVQYRKRLQFLHSLFQFVGPLHIYDICERGLFVKYIAKPQSVIKWARLEWFWQ